MGYRPTPKRQFIATWREKRQANLRVLHDLRTWRSMPSAARKAEIVPTSKGINAQWRRPFSDKVTRPSWDEELLERCAADDRAAQRSVWKRLRAWLQSGGARRA